MLRRILDTQQDAILEGSRQAIGESRTGLERLRADVASLV